MRDACVLDRFNPLFRPGSIAVVGASTSSDTIANRFLGNLKLLGYEGAVYIVHPTAEEIDGFPAYPTLGDLPTPVDYAFVSVAADRILSLFEGASGKVRFVHVISSGFAEIGNVALQQELVDACRRSGARLLGPNCLGLHSASGRISFHVEPASLEAGGVGLLSQSGGLSIDALSRGRARGIRFSAAVSLGNSADIGPVDLLEYMIADPATQVIGLYLEDVAEGRRFFELLRKGGARKPIVVLKGGRTAAGQRASASHTGALMGDDRIWQALSRQTGIVLLDTLEQFIDVLLLLQTRAPMAERATRNVALFGNGGGTSVLASDAFSRAGFDVPRLCEESIRALEALQLPPGTSIVNPIDAPSGTLRQDHGKVGKQILRGILLDPAIDLVVVHLNMSVLQGYKDQSVVPNLVRGATEQRSELAAPTHLALVLRSGGEPEVEARKLELRNFAQSLGVPVFNELADVARAFSALRELERFRLSRAGIPTADRI